VRPQATYADWSAASVHHDPDSAVQDEMHGVGRIPLAYDNFVRLNLYPLTILDELVSLLCPAERFSKPLVQSIGLAVMRLVRLDNRVLTRLSAASRLGATMIWSEINRAARNAFSTSRVRHVKIIRAPHWSATCLICVKLNVADESIPVTSRRSNNRKRHFWFASSALTCWWSRLAEPKNR